MFAPPLCTIASEAGSGSQFGEYLDVSLKVNERENVKVFVNFFKRRN